MAEGLTQKQQKEQAEAAAAKRKKTVYTVVGVVCAVAAAGLLIWNGITSSQGRRHLNDVAATVGGESYTVADLQYYYTGARNNFYQQFYQYLSSFGFDPNVSDGAQWYNEAEKSYKTAGVVRLPMDFERPGRIAAAMDKAKRDFEKIPPKKEYVFKEADIVRKRRELKRLAEEAKYWYDRY